MAESKKERLERATVITNDIFDIVDEDGNGSMDFDEFARWARSDGRPLEWLEDYAGPLLEWLDRVELENAELRPSHNEGLFSPEVAKALLSRFREDSKGNRLNEQGFIEVMLLLMSLRKTPQSTTFASRMFRFFDDDGGGSVDWAEFGTGLSMVCRGSKLDRLRCIYILIDKKQRGHINRKEFRDFVDMFWLTPVERVGKAAAKPMSRNPRYSGMSKASIMQLCDQTLQELQETQTELSSAESQREFLGLELKQRDQVISELEVVRSDLHAEKLARAAVDEQVLRILKEVERLDTNRLELQATIESQKTDLRAQELRWLGSKRQAELGAIERAQLAAERSSWESLANQKCAEFQLHVDERLAVADASVAQSENWASHCVDLVKQSGLRAMRSAVIRFRVVLFVRLITRWSLSSRTESMSRVRAGNPKGWKRRNLASCLKPKGGTPLGYVTAYDREGWENDHATAFGMDSRAHSLSPPPQPQSSNLGHVVTQSKSPLRPQRIQSAKRAQSASASPASRSEWPVMPAYVAPETRRVLPINHSKANLAGSAKLRFMCLRMLAEP